MSHTRMIVLATFVLGRVASAQQPNASAAAFGMGGNFQAAATGFNAVAWNPAMLGVGDGGFTFNLLSGGILNGFGPVKLADITDFGGKTIPASTKEAWLNQIGNGTETGGANAGLSILALSVGPVAFQLGASGTGNASLNQDAAEVLLYGNAGRTGAARDLSFNGSNANGSSFATGAVSFALPLPFAPMGGALERFSAGVTAKYVRGIAVARARDNGSSITANNIGVAFPVIVTDSDHVGNAGSGVGVDLGVAWNSGPTTIGATLRNVVNTFQWSTTSLVSRSGTVTFDGTNQVTKFDAAPYADAPASMRAALEDEKFKPELAAGIAHRGAMYTLTADASSRIGDGIDVGPKTHLGVGAEYRALSILALRAGVAAVTGGSQIAGGLGIKLGPAEVGFGMSARSMNNNTQYGAMFSLLSIH